MNEENDIDFATLETCAAATGSVVVIDVWRSFTTTAYAFAAGVQDILVVASADEAFALHARFPAAILMGLGELGGKPAAGFDYGNSPAELRAGDLHGRRMIQCTPNGTPGLVRSVHAETLLAGSFVCAHATVRYLQHLAARRVTFVCTEAGIADRACADYMAALLRDEKPEAGGFLENIRTAWREKAITLLERGVLTEAKKDKLEADLNCCLALDRFDFAMEVHRRNGLLVMEAVAESK
jgi:2-phosphosulfolactate phosphatase